MATKKAPAKKAKAPARRAGTAAKGTKVPSKRTSKVTAKTPKATKKVMSLGNRYVLAAPWPIKSMGYNSRHQLYFQMGTALEVPYNRQFQTVEQAKTQHAEVVGLGAWVVIECDVTKFGNDTNTLVPRKVVDEFNSLPTPPRKGRR
jgi:hypothetical protein